MAESSHWISVGALGTAFERDPNLLPPSAGLERRRLQLHFENGWLIEYRFTSATRLERTVLDAGQTKAAPALGSVAYSATEVRPGIFLVSFTEPGAVASVVALLLDLPASACTMMLGQLPDRRESREPLVARIAARKELTGVSVTLLSGAIDAPFVPGTRQHSATRDLIGKRVEYSYSPSERYEHLYLNDRLYTWHCVAGEEKGLADTDRCHYLKVAPELYLFVWREKIVPTLGVVLVDFRQLRSTGRIVGYEDFECRTLTSFPVGSRMRVIDP